MSKQRAATGLVAALTLALGVGVVAAAPAAVAATVTSILKSQFAGSFNAAGSYSPAAGETVAGALNKTGGAATAGSVVVNGGTDGLSFAPSIALGANGRITTSVAVEVVARRDGSATPNLDTLLSVGGGANHRLIGSGWQYDMYGPGNNTVVKQSVAGPSTTQAEHIGLVYTATSASESQLDYYVNGCKIGGSLVNGSAAELAANALGFGREVHPGAGPRGFHGTLSGVAAETFTGSFPGASAFQLPAGQTCVEQSVTPGSVIPISASDTTATLEAKAAAVRPTAQQSAWQDQRYTAFLHFNMPTFLNVEGGDGRTAATTFAPTTVDTDQWASVLKNAGYKLAVLTIKHADGFLLYDSAHSDYDIAASAYQQDVVRKFVDSMRAQGIKVGFYFSPVNRHEMNVVPSQWNANYPRFGYSAAKGTRSCAVPATPVAGKPSFTYTVDEYNCVYMRELYELFSSYGTIDEWWLDGNATSYKPGGSSWDGFSPWPTATGDATQQYNNPFWYQIAHTLQPNMLDFAGWGVRWVGNEEGFARVGGEWSHVAISNQPTDGVPVLNAGGTAGDRSTWPGATNFVWLPTEVDVPISEQGNWFYHIGDTAAPLTKLWQINAASVGRNANLLLDFGPDRAGRIPDFAVTRANELKAKIDAVFGVDLAGGCPLSVSDGGYTVGCHFPAAKTINWVGLAEDTVGHGQRVESYVVEYWDAASNTWRAVSPITWNSSGTQIADEMARIGNQRYLRLPTSVTTTDLRVRVTGSRQQPYLKSITAHLEGASTGAGATITGVSSGKCVDVQGANSQDGTDLDLWTCNGSIAQQWTYYASSGEVRAMGKCMDVEYASPADGTTVQLYTCNGSNAQKWTYDSTSKQLKALGKCLDATGGGTTDGTKLIIWTCHSGDNQKWQINP
jgi:alpha-L-fucosidase